jgi:cytoskeleton-associated protein 5
LLPKLRLCGKLDVTGFLEDLNPALLSTINSEFDKVTGQTPPEPTRHSAELQQSSAEGPGVGIASHSTGADPLDDLIPRVDLDKLVGNTNVIADSKSDSWKTRKEAFESLLAVLEQKSNSRLKANMGKSCLDIHVKPWESERTPNFPQARLALFLKAGSMTLI